MDMRREQQTSVVNYYLNIIYKTPLKIDQKRRQLERKFGEPERVAEHLRLLLKITEDLDMIRLALKKPGHHAEMLLQMIEVLTDFDLDEKEATRMVLNGPAPNKVKNAQELRERLVAAVEGTRGHVSVAELYKFLRHNTNLLSKPPEEIRRIRRERGKRCSNRKAAPMKKDRKLQASSSIPTSPKKSEEDPIERNRSTIDHMVEHFRRIVERAKKLNESSRYPWKCRCTISGKARTARLNPEELLERKRRIRQALEKLGIEKLDENRRFAKTYYRHETVHPEWLLKECEAHMILEYLAEKYTEKIPRGHREGNLNNPNNSAALLLPVQTFRQVCGVFERLHERFPQTKQAAPWLDWWLAFTNLERLEARATRLLSGVEEELSRKELQTLFYGNDEEFEELLWKKR